MRRETFEQALRAFNQARPFRRFTLELVNGVRLVSGHPEAIAFRGDLVVYVEADFTTQVFDALSVARLIDRVVPRGAE